MKYRYFSFIKEPIVKCLICDVLQVRIYAPSEQIDQAEYASKISDRLFTFYEEYFQINYTLPKSGELSFSQRIKKVMIERRIRQHRIFASFLLLNVYETLFPLYPAFLVLGITPFRLAWVAQIFFSLSLLCKGLCNDNDTCCYHGLSRKGRY